LPTVPRNRPDQPQLSQDLASSPGMISAASAVLMAHLLQRAIRFGHNFSLVGIPRRPSHVVHRVDRHGTRCTVTGLQRLMGAFVLRQATVNPLVPGGARWWLGLLPRFAVLRHVTLRVCVVAILGRPDKRPGSILSAKVFPET